MLSVHFLNLSKVVNMKGACPAHAPGVQCQAAGGGRGLRGAGDGGEGRAGRMNDDWLRGRGSYTIGSLQRTISSSLR